MGCDTQLSRIRCLRLLRSPRRSEISCRSLTDQLTNALVPMLVSYRVSLGQTPEQLPNEVSRKFPPRVHPPFSGHRQHLIPVSVGTTYILASHLASNTCLKCEKRRNEGRAGVRAKMIVVIVDADDSCMESSVHAEGPDVERA